MIYEIPQSEWDLIQAELQVNEAFGYEDNGKYLFNTSDIALYEYDYNARLQSALGETLAQFLADKDIYEYPPESIQISNTEVDEEGRQVVRRATAKKGWHYSAICAEVKTSSTNVYNKDYQGNDLNEVTIKMYDTNGDETLVPAEAVQTEIEIAPDYDFEVIEGDLYHAVRPASDVRVWTVAGAPSLGAAGVKTFVNGLNLRFMSPDDHIESDGRSSKFMQKDLEIDLGGGPFIVPGNVFKFILKHDAGFEHEVMIVLELYREA